MQNSYLKSRFNDLFATPSNPTLFFSPGRVNLIGEHIDYNGGSVFPAAITFGTYAAALKRDDQTIRLYSGNFPERGIIEFSLMDLEHKEDAHWSIYPKGVMDTFIKAGYPLEHGFDAYIEGNIPNGSGLSSSASLELLISQILDEFHGFGVSMIDKVKFSQIAENQYVGVNCGIMDQFAIGMGKENAAIRLNTNNLEYEYAEADLQDCSILIMNTNKKRELAESAYNERRQQCEAALSLLKTQKDINFLCDLNVIEFNGILEAFGENTLLYRRAKHCITENERVKNAVEALADGDLEIFGKLLNQSHISLRDDYEVTGYELDTIVKLAWEQDGVLGARMTGAGFGGCAIALVKNQKLEAIQAAIAKGYQEIIGYPADFYVASIGGGTRTLS
ncbi:MAG: galactokinase [Turicibacter sp.]|nr:galactokinase [Turicibacter sp.]